MKAINIVSGVVYFVLAAVMVLFAADFITAASRGLWPSSLAEYWASINFNHITPYQYAKALNASCVVMSVVMAVWFLVQGVARIRRRQ